MYGTFESYMYGVNVGHLRLIAMMRWKRGLIYIL